MANAFEVFEEQTKKIGTCADLLGDLERNLKDETNRELEELKKALVKGDEQEIIHQIGKICDLKKDWIQYRDTMNKVRETLANVTLSFLKKNG